MKNVFQTLIIAFAALAMVIASCKKDNSSNPDYSAINTEKANTQTALKSATSYNDTLMMYYDTAKVKKNNPYCIKYDKLYHKQDSMFSAHYSMMGDQMYKNGMMMNNYSPSGMMSKGMMSNSMMDTLKRDTAFANTCYSQMQQLHSKHQVYHTGIYN